jgi:glycosyltransferase involved in cell wall biosynthesis
MKGKLALDNVPATATDRRNVFLVADAYPTADNRVDAIYVRDQAMALSRVGRVGVAVRRTYSPREWFRIGRSARQASLHHDAGVEVYRLPRFVPTTRSDWLLRRGNRESVAAGLVRHSRTFGRPSLIHAHTAAFAGHAAVDVGKQYGIPVVITEHYSFADRLITQYGRRLLDVYERADLVLAVSHSLADRLRACGVTRPITVLGNVIDTEVFGAAPLPERVVPPYRLLCVASDRAVKDVPVLIRALYYARRCLPVECEIIGNGDYDHAREWVCALGLDHAVRFMPAVSRPELARHMADAHLIVSSSRIETFGMSLAEALCVGRPVVATRSGGPEDILGPGDGVTVPIGDPAALGDAVVEVLMNPAEYDAATIARRAHQRFGTRDWVRRLLGLYDTIKTHDD